MSSESAFQNLDLFDFRARALPALLVVLPLALGGIALVPGAETQWKALLLIAAPMGLLGLAQESLREAPRQLQKKLFPTREDLPTNRILSHRHSRLSAFTLARAHAKLRALLPALPIPADKADEEADFARALRAYESCTDFLRERTRDLEAFRLVQAENQAYVYRLTLLSLRILGRTFAWGGLGAAYLAWYFHPHAFAFGAVILNVALLSCWYGVITEGWVKAAADSYAERLVGACEVL